MSLNQDSKGCLVVTKLFVEITERINAILHSENLRVNRKI